MGWERYEIEMDEGLAFGTYTRIPVTLHYNMEIDPMNTGN
jgi:hypothetical protein